MLYAKSQRIEYMWYLGYELNANGTIKVLLHDRLKIGLAAHKHPETDVEFDTIEDDNRCILQIWLWDTGDKEGRVLDVSNPQGVFSYGRF